ncbi:hypothetical protein DL764_002952 [Monosporascus ibericus]|uniref:MYND-type domain-containing protein n=1 Tax=Monosporascus ibericus TaxID=155417 RepID=A0A4Q4TIF2_9PEZI|nr:hypothetical protein DL764_002952 [Monosporascus ibericus]
MTETNTNTAGEPEASCAKCKKTGVHLMPCERCDVVYCSRSCQTLDWKTHKKRCARNRGGNGPGGATNTSSAGSSSSSAAPPHYTNSTAATGGALEGGNPMPFTRLEKGTYLHGRPEKDTYKLLIDAYRLRLDDVAKIEGVVEPDSIYASATNDPLPGFRRFLDKASAATDGILPPWWSADKQRECEDLGMSSAGGNGWISLRKKIRKGDVTDHYGDATFPMQLRMLAEGVYGRGPGGQDGSTMRRMMAMGEAGAGPRHMSLFDASQNM